MTLQIIEGRQGCNFLYNQPLSRYSSIRIGGIAKKIALITDEEQLADIDFGSPTEVVGAGSNVLFSDKGYDGQIILLKNDYINDKDGFLTVGAGASLVKLSKHCAKLGYSGLEWASSIPSSVGGAVYMNAGAHGSSMSEVLVSCKVLRGGKLVILSAKDCGFGYRNSVFKTNGDIILSVMLKPVKEESNIIYERMNHNIATRKKTQPSGLSLGSVFKNPDKAAGYYIDNAGLKGRSVGGVYVSEKHANFILNRGDGTANDFLSLVSIIKNEVYDKFGASLEEEFIKIGDF